MPKDESIQGTHVLKVFIFSHPDFTVGTRIPLVHAKEVFFACGLAVNGTPPVRNYTLP